ncbi:MAG TPA: ABC transporter ATP-binding protein [Candidatus Scatovivens faecipullorum]|nr:ABC transporter ATP-binding protein [Candidatus Scatovivens faecipullorum]
MKNKTFSRWCKIAKPHIKTIFLVSILAIIIDLLEISKPYLVKIVIDDFLSKNIFNKGLITITTIGITYLVIVVLGNILDFFTRTKTNIMGEEILFTIRNKLYKYTQNANIQFHDKTPAGKLFARITNDVEDISALFKDVITTIFKDIFSIVATVLIMIYFSIKLSFLTFIIIPFVIITSVILTIVLNKFYDMSKIIRTNLNTFLAESIYGVKLIKIFNIQKEKQEECEDLTEKFFKARMPINIYTGLFPGLMSLFENIAIAIILVASINHWFGISVEVGSIYIFVSYIKSLFEPINRTIDNIEIVQEAIVSMNKIYDILEQTEYLEDFESGIQLEKVKGKIEFKHVWFAYEKENWVLKDINFTINPGETIALVGKTGSGKTTITNLLNRFYDIQKGEILLDGLNIQEINKRSLRKHIGTVLQDPFIFARTIKDNIKLNKKISEEDIIKAIKLSSADEFVYSLPNGLNQISKERGDSYSAGQKQLLAFARIFAHNPDIFILDEATANIDTYTENLIQKSIEILSAQKTAIFIAHRLSTIVNVDKIIVLNNGKIIEQGNHKELLKKGGYYSKLYNSYYENLG